MKLQLVAVLVFGAFAAPLHAATLAEDHAAIGQVVETFRVSLIKKDPVSFMKLFYSDTIPWIGVITDQSLARAKAEKKDLKQPDPNKLYASGNPRKFIEGFAKIPDKVEETFDNVRIDTDGDVAQVWFDYSFQFNGYKQNSGKEAWHMMRTAEGWKISSVIWSMEFNPVPAPKPDTSSK